MEKRILFRLLSGLHSSIMTQIANDYRFDGERSSVDRGQNEGESYIMLDATMKLYYVAGCLGKTWSYRVMGHATVGACVVSSMVVQESL